MNRSKYINEPDATTRDLIIKSGDMNEKVALAAQYELAQSLQEPLRQGVLVGDIATNIFEQRRIPYGTPVEFPLDILSPGEETQFVAYTNPGNGRISEKTLEGDYM